LAFLVALYESHSHCPSYNMSAHTASPRKRLLDSLSPEEEAELCAMSDHLLKRRRATPHPPSITQYTSSGLSANAKPATVVRLKRRRGVVIQGCDVYIGRACSRGGWNLPQSKWHNPYSVRACGGSASIAVARFEQYLLGNRSLMQQLGELKGKV